MDETRDIRQTPAFCPGCGHPGLFEILARVLRGRDGQKYLGVSSSGCGALVPDYTGVDFLVAPGGSGPSMAAGAALAVPGRTVFCYLGDRLALGRARSGLESLVAQAIPVLVVVANNAAGGLEYLQGGASLRFSSTRPNGPSWVSVRQVFEAGAPRGVRMHSTKLLPTAESKRHVHGELRRGLNHVIARKGPAIVEVATTCPPAWGQSPGEAYRALGRRRGGRGGKA